MKEPYWEKYGLKSEQEYWDKYPCGTTLGEYSCWIDVFFIFAVLYFIVWLIGNVIFKVTEKKTQLT